MKTPKGKWEVLIFILFLVLVYVGFGFILFGARKPQEPAGVCIYEVIVNQLINYVNIGWTPSPCEVLDIKSVEDRKRLQRSDFHPICPVFAIQTWPTERLPVVDYSKECGIDFREEERNADDRGGA